MSPTSNNYFVIWTLNTSANGCGTGSAVEGVAAFIGGLSTANFSGDRNVPYGDFSFRNACNAHDACYSGQSGKVACDDKFKTDMDAVCAGNTICKGFSNIYYRFVAAEGQAPYESAGLEQSCSLAKDSFESNECEW